jgi:soluble lytic murein transglycosylase-like protein
LAPLKLAVGALLVALGSPAGSAPVDRWRSYIAEASARFGIPETWIRRVIRAESGGQTLLNGTPVTSRAGAMGLMQLMPGTWSEIRKAYGLGSDPFDPRDNIFAGTAYLRAMYDRFGYPGLFAAYNMGPGRFLDHLVRGVRLPSETSDYLARVEREPIRANSSPKFPRAPAPEALFAINRQAPANDHGGEIDDP